jgi:hypothetical protein
MTTELVDPTAVPSGTGCDECEQHHPTRSKGRDTPFPRPTRPFHALDDRR